MRIPILAKFSLAALLAAASPGRAKAESQPALRNAEGGWSIVVQRDGLDEVEGRKSSWSVRRTYDAEITAPDAAAERTVVWTPRESAVTGVPPVDALALLHAAPLAFATSSSLKPRELTDWPTVQAAIRALSLKGTSAEAAQPLLAKLADGLNAKSAATVLLKPARMLAMPIDIPLPFEATEPAASPLGGPPVTAVYRFTADPEAAPGERAVRYVSTLDPASVAASTNAMLAKLGKPTNAALQMTRQETCRFTLDAKTAMPKEAHCTLRTTVAADGKTAERTDNLHVLIERRP